MFKALEELIEIIRSRKNATKDKSYTNQLLNNKTLSKEKTEEENYEMNKDNKVLVRGEKFSITKDDISYAYAQTKNEGEDV